MTGMSEPDPVLDAMRRHRSVRNFKQGEPVPETDTERAVEAAQCAATSSWIQAYHLLEVTDAQVDQILLDPSPGSMMHLDQKIFKYFLTTGLFTV